MVKPPFHKSSARSDSSMVDEYAGSGTTLLAAETCSDSSMVDEYEAPGRVNLFSRVVQIPLWSMNTIFSE